MATTGQIERALTKAEDALEELRRLIREGTPISETDRWRKALTLVEKKGGRVTLDEWKEIGRESGYDVRGLSGFYRGDGASMRVEEGDMRVLTDAGRAYLDQWGRFS